MIERHDDTNLWADKLQDVRIPDVAESWKLMEAGLDKAMPVQKSKDWRRWLLSLLLMLLLIGVCNCPGNRQGWRESPALLNTPSATVGHPSIKLAGKEDWATGNTSLKPAPGKGLIKIKEIPGSTGNQQTPESQRSLEKEPYIGKTQPFGKTISAGKTLSPGKDAALGEDIVSGNDQPVGEMQSSGNTQPASKTQSSGNTKPSIKQNPPDPQQSLLKTGKPANRANPDKSPNRTNPEKQKSSPERGWVAGIGLNQFFTIGQQQRSDYNSSGTTGGLSDYIPVPMVRYYLNRKLFVQLECQFNTPQYTRGNLLASQPPVDTFTTLPWVQNSVYIRKLFYFNLPLSVHFSPIRNLFLGAGMQYSRLSNAVGLFQSKLFSPVSVSPDIVKTAVKSFKSDTTYQEIRTHEFRFLVDLSYQYKSFILGARYNRALTDFINVQVSYSQVTQARNSSLQLYLRYIIWDQRKKKQLSSK